MRRLLSITVSTLAVVALIAGPVAAGSDSPTPYTVTAEGLSFPRPLAAHDHVNVRLTDGRTGHLHLDPNNGHPGARWIGAAFLPWSAVGVTDGCVEWVQVAGYDEHHGEGGQAPVCVGAPSPSPTPSVSPSPSVSPTPEPSPETSPEPSPTPSPEPSPSSTPAPSPSLVPSPEPTPEESASPTPPAPSPSAPAPEPSATPVPSRSPSTSPSPTPSDAPDAPREDPRSDERELARTGTGLALPWVAAFLLIAGGFLLALRRSR